MGEGEGEEGEERHAILPYIQIVFVCFTWMTSMQYFHISEFIAQPYVMNKIYNHKIVLLGGYKSIFPNTNPIGRKRLLNMLLYDKLQKTIC